MGVETLKHSSKTNKETENYFKGIGYECEKAGEKIIIHPYSLTQNASLALSETMDAFQKVSNKFGFSVEQENKTEQRLLAIFTPIRVVEIFSAVSNFLIFVIFLSVLYHLLQLRFVTYNLIAIVIFGILSTSFIGLFLQSTYNLRKTDEELFKKSYNASKVNYDFVADYVDILSQIRKLKLKHVALSGILLAIFVSGLLLKYPLFSYISGTFDFFGYFLALLSVSVKAGVRSVIKTSRKVRKNSYVTALLGILFLFLFMLKEYMNLIILNWFFILIEFPLLVYFFIVSIESLLRFKSQ